MKKILIVAFTLFIFNPVLVFAQPTDTTPSTTTALPTYGGVEESIGQYLCTPTGDGKDLERCINRLYRFGITAGALVLVAMVVFAGYLYITGGETGKGKAKAMILNSVVGMAILLGSYALLYFINPNLTSFRAIQPPIFTADDLPGCEDVGFGENCLPGDFYDSADMPSSSGCQSKFSSESQARQYMATFNVKTWDLSGSSKVSKDRPVTVQKCLEAKTKTIFQQIYDSPDKPPINSIGSFQWRQAVGSSKLSTHSFGLTFDVNWNENYYIKNGKTVGSFWRPCPGTNCSVYSLPINGAVVRTFKSGGFGWGGEWRSLKDYMHFSCHPKEQGKCF